MKFNILTLFPQIIENACSLGVLGQALKKELISFQFINPRSFSLDKHKTVDDRPFGGGDGMVMMVEPLEKAIKAIPNYKTKRKILLSPQGKILNVEKARKLAAEEDELIFICGRYAGIDQRFINQYVDEEISIGDYVISGGELAACVLIDAVSRFIPGVLGHEKSSSEDSFSEGFLECPLFTRPREILQEKVPEILLSGDHLKIETWKKKVGELVTLEKRPELFHSIYFHKNNENNENNESSESSENSEKNENSVNNDDSRNSGRTDKSAIINMEGLNLAGPAIQEKDFSLKKNKNHLMKIGAQKTLKVSCDDMSDMRDMSNMNNMTDTDEKNSLVFQQKYKELILFWEKLSEEDRRALGFPDNWFPSVPGLEKLQINELESKKLEIQNSEDKKPIPSRASPASSLPLPRMALALLHYPILDRQKNTVATNITNFDIHDIARASKVYGVERYYIIHPMREQLMFVERILQHWKMGEGFKYNPSRRVALDLVKTASSLEEAVKDWGEPCLTIGTHARLVPGAHSYSIDGLKSELFESKKSCFLVFGTGYGMPDDLMQTFDGVLESLKGAPPKDFRHLSVRSAVSIYLDRMMGSW